MGRSASGPPLAAARPHPPTARAKVWVCFGPRTKLGAGRARLLELINELGSIRKAVAQLGMSYRSAWGYIGELEAAAGFPLIERRPGQGPKSGTRLTGEGRRLLLHYRVFQRAVDDVVAVQFDRAFTRRKPARARVRS
jgi:molybdate transport system regulatory protein